MEQVVEGWRVASRPRLARGSGGAPGRPSVGHLRKVMGAFPKHAGMSFCMLRPQQLNMLRGPALQVSRARRRQSRRRPSGR
eukprot:3677657-Pyramimonas_sp.AAC.1